MSLAWATKETGGADILVCPSMSSGISAAFSMWVGQTFLSVSFVFVSGLFVFCLVGQTFLSAFDFALPSLYPYPACNTTTDNPTGLQPAHASPHCSCNIPP